MSGVLTVVFVKNENLWIIILNVLILLCVVTDLVYAHWLEPETGLYAFDLVAMHELEVHVPHDVHKTITSS